MSMAVLSAGIDTLHVSVRGEVKSHVRSVLEEAKVRAQNAEEPVAFEFPVTSQAFLIKPFGLRGYTYWLTSPDFELILGKGERFPAAMIQFHSAYLHACGPAMAWDLVDLLLTHDLFSKRPDVVVSRVDLYVDLQGHAQPLRENVEWAVPSPDGRHLALLEWATTGNAWVIENF